MVQINVNIFENIEIMPYKDPIKQAEAKKQWYERNKELTKKRALESKHRTRPWYREKKTQDCVNGCQWCGFKGGIDDFDYHHVEPASKNFIRIKNKIGLGGQKKMIKIGVGDMVGFLGKKATEEEMMKCIIVCKKCHANHHQTWKNNFIQFQSNILNQPT